MISTIGTALQQTSQTSAIDSQANRLLAQAKSSIRPAQLDKEDAKIAKAGKDFESILLGSWLQQAEQTFATVPGGDGQDDGDSGKDQFQGIAMQALAGSLTASGGIGIAKMITKSLHHASATGATTEEPTSPQGVSGTSQPKS